MAQAASTNDITSLVQRGLFEEEANHNLDAAMQSYENAIKLHDKDRKLAATAIFRLGECYRKQGKANEANAEYKRIISEFGDQTELAKIATQYVGDAPQQPSASSQALSAVALASQLHNVTMEAAQAEALWKHAKDLDRQGRIKFFTAIQPDQLLIDLVNRRFEANAKLDRLSAEFGTQHPQYRAQQESVRTIAAQLDERADTLIWSIEQKYKMLKEQEAALKARLNESTGPVAKAKEIVTSEEEEEIRKIKAMIQNSPDLINVAVNSDEGTPLQRAALKGYLKVSQFLLANGANPNVRTDKVSAPLICAAVHGHKAIIDLLLENGADIEIKSTDVFHNQTALMCAANRGYKTIAETLLAHRANLNAVDDTGRTPLHFAAEKGYPEVLSLLISNKARVDAKTLENKTALHLASDHNNVEAVKVLLDHGADVNAKSDGGFTPLLNACEHGNVQVAKVLLERGAKTEEAVSETCRSTNFRGWRAINYAIHRNDAPLLKLLLEHHANPNGRYKRQTSENQAALPNWLPLLEAVGYPELLEILLTHGADPNLANDYGTTPLHLAVLNFQKRAIELLLAHGANPNAVDKAGNPTIAYVSNSAQGAAEIRKMLLKAGADENYARARRISIWRDGNERVMFKKDTNNWNHFTLMELLSIIYGNNEPPRTGQGMITTQGYVGGLGGASAVSPSYMSAGFVRPPYPFPDFSRITINRLSKDGKKKEIRADIRDMLGRADAPQKDIPLEWGDIVEIPEQDHPVNKPWPGLSEPRQRQVMDVLARTVELRIKGTITNYYVLPRMPDFQSTVQWRKKAPAETRLPENAFVSEFGLTQFINKLEVLRSSSDSSHVKVTRTKNGSTQSVTVNLFVGDELWIESGDIIEIPDRESDAAAK